MNRAEVTCGLCCLWLAGMGPILADAGHRGLAIVSLILAALACVAMLSSRRPL